MVVNTNYFKNNLFIISMIPEELKGKNCMLYRNLDLIGKKWSIFILLELAKEKNLKIKYNDILKILPSITPRALSLRLKLLEDNGIIKKEILNFNNQINCNYYLSEAGVELIPIIINLQQWGTKHGECEPKKQCIRCDFIYN